MLWRRWLLQKLLQSCLNATLLACLALQAGWHAPHFPRGPKHCNKPARQWVQAKQMVSHCYKTMPDEVLCWECVHVHTPLTPFTRNTEDTIRKQVAISAAARSFASTCPATGKKEDCNNASFLPMQWNQKAQAWPVSETEGVWLLREHAPEDGSCTQTLEKWS